MQQFQPNIRICDINKQSTEAFVEFLQSEATDEHGCKLCRMKVEDAVLTFENTLRVAVKHNWINRNYAFDIEIENLKGEIDNSEHLTDQELAILEATPCEDPAIKEVFLVCCYTNLSSQEAFDLKWSDIVINEKGRMQVTLFNTSTKMQRMLIIPEKAQHFLPQCSPSPDGLVFHPLSNETKYINDVFGSWTQSSMLERRITFNKYKPTFKRVHADRVHKIRYGK